MKDLKFDFFHYYSTIDGGYKDGVTVFSFHTMRMQAYKDDWSLEQIVVYEALLNRSRRYNHSEFYYQQKRLMSEFRVGEHKLRKCINKLKDLNLISVKRKKTKEDRKNYYTVNFDVIRNNLDRIYDFRKFPDDSMEYFVEMFQNFYRYFEYGETFSFKSDERLTLEEFADKSVLEDN